MISVKTWRELNSFDPLHGGEQLDIEGTVSLIAKAQEKPIEEIENLPIEDLLPTFLDEVHKANELVFSKINKIPKNASGDERKQE